ncbi:MAG: RNA-binding protein [Pseudomonadota bacterium]
MPRQSTNDTRGLTAPADGPVRQCAATRERLAQTEMIRFARAPDGALTPDVAARLPGRGVWVKADRKAVCDAAAKGAFARSLKQPVEIPADLADMVEALLLKQCQGLLGLARRSGAAILGFDQVRAALKKEAPGCLLEASDGAEDGRRKVVSLAKALHDPVSVAGALSSAELGMAFGRPRVIHGLIVAGAFSDKWRIAYARLTGFRPRPEDSWFSGRDR